MACDVITAKFGHSGKAVINVTDDLHGVIVGLNWMYGVRSTDLAIRELTAAQLEAHSVIIARATDLHARLMGSIDSRANSGWGTTSRAAPRRQSASTRA